MIKATVAVHIWHHIPIFHLSLKTMFLGLSWTQTREMHYSYVAKQALPWLNKMSGQTYVECPCDVDAEHGSQHQV